jgi:hypothetical protein
MVLYREPALVHLVRLEWGAVVSSSPAAGLELTHSDKLNGAYRSEVAITSCG